MWGILELVCWKSNRDFLGEEWAVSAALGGVNVVYVRAVWVSSRSKKQM